MKTWALILALVGVWRGSAIADDWQKPWASEKVAAAARCAETFEDYQLQAICMDNEKDGHQKMQSDFGPPAQIAEQAKKRCVSRFEEFQLQAVCMQNEKDGYEKLKRY